MANATVSEALLSAPLGIQYWRRAALARNLCAAGTGGKRRHRAPVRE